MFRKIYNQASITGFLVPDGPVTIVAGGGSLDPVAPALAFVRSGQQAGATVYLPGSSLKGVLRAQGERILATLVGEAAAEDPFDFHAPNRTKAQEARKEQRRAEVFKVSCPADRLYGSTEVAGRFQVSDALPEAEVRLETRFNVSIDRKKQSVRHGPFETEVVTAGRFRFHATLENFELWMLALVLQGLRDLDEGYVRIGHAKSRGLGKMKFEDAAVEILWPGRRPPALDGAGACEQDPAQRQAYGLHADDQVPLPAGAQEAVGGLLQGWRFEGYGGLLQAVSGEVWKRFVDRSRGRVA